LDSTGLDIATDPRGQNSPSCASDGDEFLVSFNSYRCDSSYGDIFAARISASGEVLDTNGFSVCEAAGDQNESRVSYGNGYFLVLWEDERDFDSTGFDIYGSRINPAGMVLDPDGKEIATLPIHEKAPNLTWYGENFFALWEVGGFDETWDIVGAFIDTSGTGLGSDSVLVSTACGAQLAGRSSWNGCFYLAIWEENSDLYGKRMDHFGNILDSASIPVCVASEDQKRPSVTWGGESFLAVWEDLRNLDFDVYGTRIDSSGEVLDLSNLPIWADSASHQISPAAASDGENFLVIWSEDSKYESETYDIQGVRVSPEGEVLDTRPFSVSSAWKGSDPAVAFGGEKYLAVWVHVDNYDIRGAFVDTSGTASSPFWIGVANGMQVKPQVASDGTDFLVVWEDYGTHWPNTDINGTRVTSEGAVLDPYGLFIANTQDPEELPSVSFDGTNYGVIWKKSGSESSELRLSRITQEGEVLELDGIVISDVSPYSSASISSGPTDQSLMLYSKYQGGLYNSPRIFGALFWGEVEPNQPPDPFSLLLPEDKDTLIRPVSLDWEDASDPNASDWVTYTLYVSPSEQFSPESTFVIDSLNLSQSDVSLEQDSMVYWWKVRAQDRWGEVRWSNQIWSFDLENYGDATGDGQVDISDVILLINYLFIGGSPPEPLSGGDANGDCVVDVADVVYLTNYLFTGGSRPRPGCA
jgi:hypothetical protein